MGLTFKLNPLAQFTMAKGGKLVRDGGYLYLSAGAEPLSQPRLSVGHQVGDRPSGISDGLLKEEILGDQLD